MFAYLFALVLDALCLWLIVDIRLLYERVFVICFVWICVGFMFDVC